jgi:hypothetical protein
MAILAHLGRFSRPSIENKYFFELFSNFITPETFLINAF